MIIAKHKKSSQNLWESLKGPFKTFKSSRIRSKARKLGSTWTQAKKRWKAVLHALNATGRSQNKSFLHRIVAGDKKWIHYENSKGKKSYVKPGQPAKSTAKTNIHGAKVMLSIWWDQKGVLYCEPPKPGETIFVERYRTQLIRLTRATAEKRTEYATRHEAIIFHI